MALERIVSVTPQFNGTRLRISLAVRDLRGAIEFWFSASAKPSFDGASAIQPGGVECHSATPLEYSRDREVPDHADCSLIGRCWHDGSSLYAEEVVFPVFMEGGAEATWPLLEDQHRKQFEGAV